MKLLNIRDNKPYVKKEIKDKDDNTIEPKIEYLRDWCFLNFGEDGTWTIEVNDEVKSGKSLKELQQLFFELRNLKKAKHRTKIRRRLVIWVNNLSNKYLDLIVLVCETNLSIHSTDKGIKSILMWAADENFEFRSFNAISGDSAKKIKEIYSLNGSEVDVMKEYIQMQPEQNWAKFRYTASHCFEKQFEKRVKKNLDEKLEKNYSIEMSIRSRNEEFNKWIRKSCLSGALWIDKATQRKPLEWVSSFDISQAYGGQFVRANDFPLGEIKNCPAMPKEEVMKRKWYCFVFEFDKKPESPFVWMQPFQKDKNDKDGLLKEGKWYYVIEKADIECMRIMEAKFNVRPRIIRKFYCDEVGYLNFGVRKTINDLYNERQELKKEGNKMEKIVKQINEVVYGKGLQDRMTRNHYFCPQISYHALAKTRYEICLMMKRIKNGLVACDTDGIKTTCRNAISIFFERNNEIQKELAAAGFPDTKIGTWKFEGTYKKFIQYERKVYAYEDGEGLHCKFAGCNPEQLKDFLIECRDFNGLLNNLAIPGGVVDKHLVVSGDSYAVETIYRDYSLVKEELNAFLKRQKIVCEVA